MKKVIRRMVIGAGHYLENLSTELYEKLGDCLWEIVRNGVIACMPGEDWLPGVGDVEITLVKNHPLSPKNSALVVLDRGTGFTEPRIELYCMMGRSTEDMKRGKGTHGGAAQKRIGRFAAFGLNKGCREGDVTTGFYILTRTSSTDGSVKLITMIPAELQKDGGWSETEVSPTSIELGPLRGIKGSFTAIVIPNPVFENYEEIRQALEWRIPRKPKQMFKLTIGGKKLEPPVVVSRVDLLSPNAEVEVRIARAGDEVEEDPDKGGIWLTDAATGIRVVYGPRLGAKLPNPFWRRELVGDIFIRNLLANQDTTRSNLLIKYLKSDAWKRAHWYLASQVSVPANALLGKHGNFGSNKVGSVLEGLVSLFSEAWGTPEVKIQGPVVVFPGNGFHSSATPRLRNPNPVPRVVKPGPRVPGPDVPPKPQVVPLKIGNDTFLLQPRTLDSLIFAQVEDLNGQVLYINDRSYEGLPPGAAAIEEHAILKVLEAVGSYMHKRNPEAVTKFVGQHCKDLRKVRKK